MEQWYGHHIPVERDRPVRRGRTLGRGRHPAQRAQEPPCLPVDELRRLRWPRRGLLRQVPRRDRCSARDASMGTETAAQLIAGARACHKIDMRLSLRCFRGSGGDPRGATRQARRTRMTSPGSGWNAIMQYSFLHVFANDRTIDSRELAMLQKLALSDSQVDDQERAVLSRVFSRISETTVSPDVWQEVCQFKERYEIP